MHEDTDDEAAASGVDPSGRHRAPIPHRESPCGRCPWRRDVEPGQFSAQDYADLEHTCGRPGHEVGTDAAIWACHKSREGNDLTCAGWLAVVGWHHLGMRIAGFAGRLPATAFTPDPAWPSLHDSFAEMVEAKVLDQGQTSSTHLGAGHDS